MASAPRIPDEDIIPDQKYKVILPDGKMVVVTGNQLMVMRETAKKQEDAQDDALNMGIATSLGSVVLGGVAYNLPSIIESLSAPAATQTTGTVGAAAAEAAGAQMATEMASGAAATGANAVAGGGAGLPAAEAGGASLLGQAAGPVAMALMAQQAYEEYGGRQILKGDAKTNHWIDAGLASNPLTAWANPVMGALGMGKIGDAIAGDSVAKERRDLAKSNLEKLGITEGHEFILPSGEAWRTDDRMDVHGGPIDPDVFMDEEAKAKAQRDADRGYYYGNRLDWTNPETGTTVGAAAPIGLLSSPTTDDMLNQVGQTFTTNALLQMAPEERTPWIKDKYASMGFKGPDDVVGALGALSNKGSHDAWDVLVGQREVNKQYEVPGASSVNLGDPNIDAATGVHKAHMGAYKAHLAKEASYGNLEAQKTLDDLNQRNPFGTPNSNLEG